MIMRFMYECGLILILLLIGVLGASKNKKLIAVNVRNILLTACVPVCCQMIITISNIDFLSRVTYSVFFIGIELLLYQFMLFGFEYTRTEKPGALKILYVIMGCDIISILLNIYTGHVGECELRYYTDGNKPYYGMNYHMGYYCHLLVSYMIVAVIVGVLLRKIFRTAQLYWIQYLLILGSLALVVLWNVVYAVFDSEVDHSVIGYAICGILLFYFSLYFKPKSIIGSLLAGVTTNLANGIVCYDSDDVCIFMNSRIREYLQAESDEEVLKNLEKLKEESKLDTTLDENYVVHEFRMGEEIRYIELEFQRLKEKHGKVIGYFYELTDRTKEMYETKQHVYLSTHDEMTGLHNERWLHRKINLLLRHEQVPDYYVIVYDIVNFKVFNDNFGRAKGNEVLKKLADTLISIEEFDDKVMSARISGGKFAVLISKEIYNYTSLGEKIEETEFLLENTAYPVYVHAGIYDVSQFGVVSADIMIDRATFALTTISHLLGSRIVFYDTNMKEELTWNQTISAELEKAVGGEQLELFLQPQLDGEGKLLGGEALVRWRHPEFGMLTPDRFLPVFEKNGLITRIDSYMWHTAAKLVRKWEKNGIKGYVSVNISPVDIYLLDVYEEITGIVKQYGINPKHLKLEITETMISKNLNQNIRLVERLQNYGFTVEMDDFGSGYSSLNMLKNIQVDVIKLDMKFLQETRDEERSRIILRSIFDMTEALGLMTIAEGVENQEQLDLLKGMGCNVYQGYYFSKPVTVSEYEMKYFGGEVEE